jgi:Phage Terminase
MLTGQAEDDSLFGFLARVDEKDRETLFDDEACWPKALPALGVTYPVDNVRKRVAGPAARQSGAHVTVGVSVDDQGNLQAYVKDVARQTAASSIRSVAGSDDHRWRFGHNERWRRAATGTSTARCRWH